MKSIQNIVTLFLLTLTQLALSQNAKIDSLKTELHHHKTIDSTRVSLLNNLAFALKKIDTTAAEAYLKESSEILEVVNFPKGRAKNMLLNGIISAQKSKFEDGFSLYEASLQLNKDIGYAKGIIECYLEMGDFYYRKGIQQKAIDHYQKALIIGKKLDDKEAIFKLLNDLGWSHILLGNYDEAEAYYKNALVFSEVTKNRRLLANTYSDLGIIFSYKGNYNIALKYYNKSIEVAQKASDSIAIGNAFGNMGPIYTELENYDEAIKCYNKSLLFLRGEYKNATASNFNNLGLAYTAKKNYKTAQEYLLKSKKVYQQIGDKGGEATVLNNIADIHLGLKEYNRAEQCFNLGKKLGLEIDNERIICYSYLGLAKIFITKNKFNEALICTYKGKKIADKLKLLNFQRDSNELLSEIYNNMGNYKKAYESHQQYKILNDSLFNKKNIEKLAQMESDYKYKQALDSASIRELKLTEQVTATGRDLEKSKQNYLWAIIGVLLISIILGSIIFFQKFKSIKVKNQTIATEQKLLRSQMTPHFIFNSLSVLQGMILNKEDNKSVTYLSKFSKLMRITLENSRDKLVLLSQELLAIENYLALQDLENESYQYSISVDNTIDSDVFQIPPMLIQPFVENAIEHAFTENLNPKIIDINLNYSNKNLICTITDNGIGINAQKDIKNGNKTSLATTITSERLKILSNDLKVKGWVTIEDRQNYNEQGTIVTLVIPHKLVEV